MKTTLFQDPFLVKDIQDILTSIQPWNCGVKNIFVLIYAISMASTICFGKSNSKKVWV
jgi:hypothetical protein